jgi:MFS family permease
LVTPTLSSVLAGKVGAERRGGLLGAQQAAGGLARIVGPVAAGFAFGHIGVPVPYAAGAVIMLLAAGGLAAAGDVMLPSSNN